MDLAKLEKAAKILAQIQTLDKEIIEIDKFAIKVANRDCDCNIKIDLTEVDKENKKENVFDEYGFIKNQYLTGDTEKPVVQPLPLSSLFDRWGVSPASITPVKPVDQVLGSKLSDKETLQILGILLNNKNEARKVLLKSLKLLGYES